MKTQQFVTSKLLLAGVLSANAVGVLAAPPTHFVARSTAVQATAQLRSIVRGEVISVQGNRFQLRPDNGGKTYTVENEGAPVSLSRGQIVRVNGFFRNEVFVVNTVQILEGASQMDITGVVQSVSNNRTFTLTQSGSTRRYVVQTSRNMGDIARGDAVRVRGTLNGNVITATEIAKTSDGSSEVSAPIDITGRVVDMKSARDFVVLLPNNVRYRVLSRSVLRRVQEGDTVRVQGTRRPNVRYTIDATSVSETSGDNNNNTGQGAINLNGTIQVVRTGQLVIVTDKTRAMSAKRYTVNSASIRTNSYRKGQRVAVNGVLYSNNIVEANTIRVIR